MGILPRNWQRYGGKPKTAKKDWRTRGLSKGRFPGNLSNPQHEVIRRGLGIQEKFDKYSGFCYKLLKLLGVKITPEKIRDLYPEEKGLIT